MAMTQTEAREKAKKLGGVAVTGRITPAGTVRLGGWPSKNDRWFVVTLDKKHILAY